jgi:AcrR family transcriptional regulator
VNPEVGPTVVENPAAVAPAARPGRQRSEAADQAILAATLEVLALDGYGALTMAAVIARSGVSSATLYRRWQTKHELVVAALASLHAEIVDPDAGSLAGDLAAMTRDIANALSIRRDDVSEAVFLALRRYPDFSAALQEKLLKPRVAVMARVLDRAKVRGELGPGLSAPVAMSFLAGPLQYRVHTLGETITPVFARAVVTAALASLQTLAPPS